MLISEFARRSDLPVDTVRFYVKRGLLRPLHGAKGGSRPYQIFSPSDLEIARVIRVGQALGLSLTEIDAFIEEIGVEAFSGAGGPPSELVAFLAHQRDRLRKKAADLDALARYLDTKMAWLTDPTGREPPVFPQLE